MSNSGPSLSDLRRAVKQANVILSVVAIGAIIAGLASAQPAVSLASDLVLTFQCKRLAQRGIGNEALENTVVLFLEEKRFKTVNISELARKHGTYRAPLEIAALDEKDRIVDVIDLTRFQNDIVLTLITPPPTQRSATLEKELEDFVVHGLGCDIVRIGRNQNDAAAKSFHQSEVARIRQLLRDAEELQGKHRS